MPTPTTQKPAQPRTFASITPVVIPATPDNPYPTIDLYAVATDGTAWVQREFAGAWARLPDLPGVSLLSASAQELLLTVRELLEFHADQPDGEHDILDRARALVARLHGPA